MALSDSLSEAWQLNETAGLRMGSVGGARLKPYTAGAVDARAIERVAGPTGLGYAAQFVAANSEHLSQAVVRGSTEAVELGGLGVTGWWIWAWVKFTSLPASNASMTALAKNDATAGNEYGLSLFNNSGASYQLRLIVTGLTNAEKTIVPDTTDWHLIEGWWDPATDLLNVAYDGGAPGTSAAATAHTSKNCPFHIGALRHNSEHLNGSVAAVGVRKLAPGDGEREELWNGGDGVAYPFGAVSGGTRGARLDNTDGAAAVPEGGALPLFLPPSFDWDELYYGNGDDLTAEDADSNELTVWPEQVDKGNKFGRVWVAAPEGGVGVGDTADITLSFGGTAQFSSANYDTLFSKRTADGDTVALFHCDTVSAPAFDPDSVSGLTLDLNPETFGLDDADPIVTAPDSSSEGNDYAQSDASKRPIYKEAIVNGKGVMRFPGTDEYLTGPATSALFSAAAHCLFVVMKTTTYTLAAAIPPVTAAHTVGLVDVDTYHGAGSDSGAGVGTDPAFYASVYDGVGHKVAGVVSDTSWHVYEVRHEGGTLYVSQDGGAEDTEAAGNIATMTGLTRIGANSSLAAFLNGDIARILAYNVAPSSGDRTYLRDGLATEYGL